MEKKKDIPQPYVHGDDHSCATFASASSGWLTAQLGTAAGDSRGRVVAVIVGLCFEYFKPLYKASFYPLFN